MGVNTEAENIKANGNTTNSISANSNSTNSNLANSNTANPGIANSPAVLNTTACKSAGINKSVLTELACLRSESFANGGGVPLGLNFVNDIYYSVPQKPILILGPSRSGKSSSVIVPAILSALGPVVSLSTKTDIMQTTAKVRSLLGNIWCFDPTDSISSSEFEKLGVKKLKWSPMQSVGSWESALRVANLIVSSSTTVGGIESNHWNERAEALLAPIIYAAKLTDRSMKDIATAVLSKDLSWVALAIDQYAKDSMAKFVLSGILTTEDRELSGIFSTAASLLTAYKSNRVLENSIDPNFEISSFVNSADTLYIAVSGEEQHRIAPLVVTLLDSIKSETYRRYNSLSSDIFTKDTINQRMLFALDELGQTAKLPFLPSLIAEGGGQGITTIGCFQDLSQAVGRYGSIAEGFLTLFPTKLVFPGVSDKKTVEAISTLAGEREDYKYSYNYGVSQNRFNGSVLTKILNSKKKPSLTNVSKSTQLIKQLPCDRVSMGLPNSLLIVDSPKPPLFLKQNSYYKNSQYLNLIDGAQQSVDLRSKSRLQKDVSIPNLKEQSDLGLSR
jgi:type IV secretory pathway TraG/TraD family ATPase VirD4